MQSWGSAQLTERMKGEDNDGDSAAECPRTRAAAICTSISRNVHAHRCLASPKRSSNGAGISDWDGGAEGGEEVAGGSTGGDDMKGRGEGCI